jgi:O-methyltransferase involved in polyketide biosynthesis
MQRQNDSLRGDLPKLDSVAETMLIPLCYRAVEARQKEPLVCDPRAQEIMDGLGVDPRHLKWRAAQQVYAMLRARQFDRWTREFLASHAHTLVVEIGCGLDARFERVDDGRVEWIDMDLPEVMDVRKRFFADTSHRKAIAGSILEQGWMENLPVGRNILFLAEGVFAYFKEDAIRRVFIDLAERFPGAEMIVDALSPWMVRSSAVVPWFRGYQTRPRWGLNDPCELNGWGSGIRLLTAWGYFEEEEPRLKDQLWMARIPIFRDSARVLRLRLGPPAG